MICSKILDFTILWGVLNSQKKSFKEFHPLRPRRLNRVIKFTYNLKSK